MLEIGTKAPDFSLPDINENLVSLKDFKGEKVMLWFFTKANTLGTDGCASNNNLDIFEEMKFASLLEKLKATAMPAQETFELATINGAKAFNLNCGEIKEGKLADLLLVDLNNIYLNPQHKLISNLVYACNGSCVDTTICDGKILMENGKVEGGGRGDYKESK